MEAREPSEVFSIGNAPTRFGSALSMTASICVDYRLQELIGSDFDECHRRSAIKLSNLCAKNGGLYIKAAQHLSAMDNLVPEIYVTELARLQDQAPANSVEIVKSIFESELGLKFDDIFSEICHVPIGSASIGQVHVARLKLTGEQVALKVQHPNIKKDSRVDLEALKVALKIVKFTFPSIDFDWFVDELRDCLNSELDLRNEAKNSKLAWTAFSKDPKFSKLVLIPTVYENLSTERILTMQYIPGYKINDIEGLEAANINLDDVNKLMFEVFMEMIFKHNFVHCDPHAGNILVAVKSDDSNNENDGKFKIVLLDHGIYKKIPPQFLTIFSRLFLAIFSGKEEEIDVIFKELNFPVEVVFEFKKFIQKMKNSQLDPLEFRLEFLDILKSQPDETKRKTFDALKSLPRELFFIIKVFELLRSNERSLTRNNNAVKSGHLSESLIILTWYGLNTNGGNKNLGDMIYFIMKSIKVFSKWMWIWR